MRAFRGEPSLAAGRVSGHRQILVIHTPRARSKLNATLISAASDPDRQAERDDPVRRALRAADPAQPPSGRHGVELSRVVLATGRTSYHPVMKTSGITAALPAQDLGRAKAFYVEKVGLQALESGFLKARDGQVGLTVGDGVSQLFVYPARVRSSGEFTQAVIHVTDVRAAVEQMRGRGVEF